MREVGSIPTLSKFRGNPGIKRLSDRDLKHFPDVHGDDDILSLGDPLFASLHCRTGLSEISPNGAL